jgi:hypothetical protein
LGQTYDVAILDESQELTYKELEGIRYTLATAKNPLYIYSGTPPTEQSKGDVIRVLREQIRSKEIPGHWFEFGVAEFCRDPLNRENLWKKANPSYGILISKQAILGELSGKDLIDFNHQRLGWWGDDATRKGYFEPAVIQALSVPQITTDIKNGPFIAGLKLSFDMTTYVLAISNRSKEVAIASTGSMLKKPADALKMLESKKISKVYLDESGRGILMRLLSSKVALKTQQVKVAEIQQANATLEFGITNKEVKLCQDNHLTQALSFAEKRAIGKLGFGFIPMTDDLPKGIIDACALALWGMEKELTKKPLKVIV